MKKGLKRAESYVRIFAAMHTHPTVLTLPHPAFRLWFDLRVQWTGGNNGRLKITPAIMERRGWTSRDTLIRARDELLRRGLIKLTRYCGPNAYHRANLYALTDLDVAESEADGIVGSAATHDYRKWADDGVLRCPPHGHERDRQTYRYVTARRTTAGPNVTAARTTQKDTQAVEQQTESSVLTASAPVVRPTVIRNIITRGVGVGPVVDPVVAPVIVIDPRR